MESHDARGAEFLEQVRAGVSYLCQRRSQLLCILEESGSNLEVIQFNRTNGTDAQM